jgi:hypothetical protein
MGWIASFFVAILTAIATLFGAGTVAGLAVDWYNISSFEGGSGFFVVGMALLGGMAGFVIGLIVSRVIASLPRPSFVKALGGSVGAAAVILSVIAGGSYVFADIAPTIDGEELFLLAEIRWPASGQAAPASLDGVPYLRIGALQGRTVRRQEDGLVFVEDARVEGGRWIVPGAVPVFTRRGGRLLQFGTEAKTLAAFDVPLPRYPGKPQQQWSEWLPAARPGAPTPPDQFSYRYKVVRTSEPVRTEVIGPFEVDTVARYFYYIGENSRLAANATFRIRHKGQPIAGIPEAQLVATVANARPALFVVDEHAADGTPSAIVMDLEGAARVQRISGCGTPVTVHLLTSDQARFAVARAQSALPGWIDRTSFAQPGRYQLDAAILDTRDLSANTFVFPESVRPDTGVRPLDLSPDESSFVWLAQGYEEQPRLGVTNWRTGDSYVLPIDRVRMRFNTASSLDPRWVQHHFGWTRGANGVDVLTERPDFVMLPYRGDLELGQPGEYQGYTLRPGGEALRDAVVELLVRDLGGERLPDDPGAFQQQVKVNGKTISVSVIGSPSYVAGSMDAPEGDRQAMSMIAARLDAAFASGKYDALFVAAPELK